MTEEEIKALQERLAAVEAANIKLSENNKALLTEKVNTQKTAEAAIKAEQEKAKAEQDKIREEAVKSGDSSRLLDITKQELADRDSKIKEYEAEKAEREDAKQTKSRKEAFKGLFKDHDFNNFEHSFNSLSEKDKALFVEEMEEVEGKKVFKGYNADGLKQLQSKFIKESSWHFKDKAGDVDRTAARSGTGAGETDKEVMANFSKSLLEAKNDPLS